MAEGESNENQGTLANGSDRALSRRGAGTAATRVQRQLRASRAGLALVRGAGWPALVCDPANRPRGGPPGERPALRLRGRRGDSPLPRRPRPGAGNPARGPRRAGPAVPHRSLPRRSTRRIRPLAAGPRRERDGDRDRAADTPQLGLQGADGKCGLKNRTPTGRPRQPIPGHRRPSAPRDRRRARGRSAFSSMATARCARARSSSSRGSIGVAVASSSKTSRRPTSTRPSTGSTPER